MTKEEHLLSLLENLQGSGHFEVSGTRPFVPPGLSIEGIGEIGFPVHPIMVKEIIKHSKRAPFGLGSQTILDTSVRSAWEIDASQITFSNALWPSFLEKILKKVKKGLGINNTISASFYKLLIYEEGDFFLPHKDSEKEPGMFGTLILGLPSRHTGGELFIRFKGLEKKVELGAGFDINSIPFVAFYADCEHEVKPVTSGNRVNLVYNLLQDDHSGVIPLPDYEEHIAHLTRSLIDMRDNFTNRPKIVLFDHQYTPANFSLGNLKNHDMPRAKVLMAAAESAGYLARLVLATHYQCGDAEIDDYGHYGYNATLTGEMGEIHEEYTQIQYWADSTYPNLGNIDLNEEDFLAYRTLGVDDEPIEQEEEGYTGNAGMTVEYWYHYGAILLWPKENHLTILFEQSTLIQLSWIEYYLKNWDDPHIDAAKSVSSLLSFLADKEIVSNRYDLNKLNFDPIAEATIRLEGVPLMNTKNLPIFVTFFQNISVERWNQLILHFAPNPILNSIIEGAAHTKQFDVVQHLLHVLIALKADTSVKAKEFVVHHVKQLPGYLSHIGLHENSHPDSGYSHKNLPYTAPRVQAVADLLALSVIEEDNESWLNDMVSVLTANMNRKYTNKVLHPLLTSGKYNDTLLGQRLAKILRDSLVERSRIMPQPPVDWRREVPKRDGKRYKEEWAILIPFLESSTTKQFDYRQRKELREEMESAIASVTIDLQMETIRKGSPHILRITKTSASYNRALKHWKEDQALLLNF